MNYYNKRFFAYPETSPAILIKKLFRSWGRSFLYDFNALKTILEKTMFKNICRVKIKESSYPELRGIERHGQNTDEKVNAVESLIVEAK